MIARVIVSTLGNFESNLKYLGGLIISQIIKDKIFHPVEVLIENPISDFFENTAQEEPKMEPIMLVSPPTFISGSG